MPRTARLYYPGGVFHLISRCADQGYLLDGEAERSKYLELLARALGRTDARLLAWCVMSNHTHLVVLAGADPLWRLTKPINTGYAAWKNRREGRVGPVFADRPRTVLVQRRAHLLELVRYVHLNPVRAGLARRAEDSSWSSHRCYLEQAVAPPWLDRRPVLELLAPGEPASAGFEGFVARGQGQGRRADLAGEVPHEALRQLQGNVGRGARFSDAMVGSPEFVSRVLESMGRQPRRAASGLDVPDHQTPDLDQLVLAACEVMGLDRETFIGHPKASGPRTARQLITWLWVRHYGKTQSKLVRRFEVGSDQVCRWYGKALDSRQRLQPLLHRVVAMLPPRANS